jgi:Pyruvate/2-oxoacid:ferredoxin oxidoreductase gamma subunit
MISSMKNTTTMHLTETGGERTSNQGSRNMVMAGLLLGTLGIFVSEANQPPC